MCVHIYMYCTVIIMYFVQSTFVYQTETQCSGCAPSTSAAPETRCLISLGLQPHSGLRQHFRPELGWKYVTLFLGTPVCPYGTVCRRGQGWFTSGLLKTLPSIPPSSASLEVSSGEGFSWWAALSTPPRDGIIAHSETG